MKKRLLHMLLAAAMVVSAVGCGSVKTTNTDQAGNSAVEEKKDGGGTAASDGGVVEIRFTEWDGGDTLAVYEEIAENFNKEHPNIHVTVMNIPDEYDTKITSMIAGNDIPEICCLNADTLMYKYAEEGIVLNLNDFMERDPEFDKDNLMDPFTFMLNDDYMAGYGIGSENICMFYNPAIFEKYGVEEPPASYADAWDWDTFVNICQQLTVDKNGKNALDPEFDPENIDTYGINISKWWAGYMPFIYTLGGDYLTEDGSKVGYAEDYGITALQNLSDLIYKYHVAPTPTASETMPGLSEALVTGKVAMAFDGQWVNATLMADEVEYNVAALPKMGGDSGKTVMTYGGISIMNTDKKEAAWEFMKYLLSKGACEPLYKSGLWLPTTKAELSDAYIKTVITDKHPSNYYEAIVKPQVDGTAEPSTAAVVKNFAKINDILNPALDDVWSGEKTAAEAMGAIKDQANKEVQGWFGK
nr:sugar ABC transporter substrate-binding protein [uncultured Eisenbergiella sp.]